MLRILVIAALAIGDAVVLAGLGFRVLALGALLLADQVRAVRRARVIAAPHGAGHAYLLVARPGTQALGPLGIRDGVHPFAFCMVRLSRLRGHRHAIWIQRGPPSTEKALIARIPGVLAAVREMLG